MTHREQQLEDAYNKTKDQPLAKYLNYKYKECLLAMRQYRVYVLGTKHMLQDVFVTHEEALNVCKTLHKARNLSTRVFEIIRIDNVR